MAITTTLAACSSNPALNGPDGATDIPSTLDDAIRYALSFIAQIRDGAGVSAPTGTVQMFAGTAIPGFWLLCNGQAVSRATYSALFAVIGVNYGIGDGATTFNVPDLRAMFVRGVDAGRGVDPGRVIGTQQGHGFQSHNHGVNDAGHTHGASTVTAGGHSHAITDPGHSHAYGINNVNTGAVGSGAPRLGANVESTSSSGTGIVINGNGDHTHGVIVNNAGTGISIQSIGIVETRPVNVAMNFIIKI